MRNTWLVLRHDLGVTLRQRSFWILAFLLPILLVGLQAFLLLQSNELSATRQAQSQQAQAALPALGLVDPGGLITRMPPGVPADLFTRYGDQATARRALESGVVEQYVVVPTDYLATGQVTVYDKNFQILLSGQNMGVAYGSAGLSILQNVIDYNLTGDERLVTALQNPTPGQLAQMHALTPPQPAAGGNQALGQLLSSVVPYVYYFLLVMGASYLMRTVVAEKENRTAEVLLLSVDPRQMMVGKILAMSVVLLIQVVVWVGGGALALNRGATLLQVAQFHFPPGFLVWAILFLVLGYLVFASIMAAAGTLANNIREANQVTWLLVIPLLPTLMFGPLLMDSPQNPVVLFLSLFPFSSPSAMVTRLAVQNVPPWQILLSLALLAGTAYGMVLLAARFFRAGNLLSAESFNWRRFLAGWGRRAE